MQHDGYNYKTKNKERTRYGCIKPSCRAKLYIDKNQDPSTIRIPAPHTCLKTAHQSADEKLMREKLKENAANSCSSTPRVIFDETSFQNKKIACSVGFASLESTIQNAKRKSRINPGFAKQYSSIRAFGNFLVEYPEVLKFKENGDNYILTAEILKSSAEYFHLIIYNKQLIQQFDNNCDIFVDGTFAIRPNIKGVQQVLTVMSKKYNIVVPCVWVLMSNRTTKSYLAVWNHLKEHFPKFRPMKAKCDFEKALINSLRAAFDGINVRGCYFHFCQATLRKAKSKDYRLYVKKNAEKNPEGHEILKKIHVLPLLPAEKIAEGVEIILQLVNEKFEKDPINLKKWRKYITVYFNKEWIKTISPKVFSVFKDVDRTNNYLESYHRSMNATLRTKPTVFNFLFGIVKLVEKSGIELERAKKKIQTTVGQKLTTRLRDDCIRDAWTELESSHPWSVSKFLNEMAGYDDNSLYETMESIEFTDAVIEEIEKIEDSDNEDPEMDFNDFKYLSDDEISQSNESMTNEKEQLTSETVVEHLTTKKDLKKEKKMKEESKEDLKKEKKKKVKECRKRKLKEVEIKENKNKQKSAKVSGRLGEGRRIPKKNQDENYSYY